MERKKERLRRRDYRERKQAIEKKKKEEDFERKKKIRERMAEFRLKRQINEKILLSQKLARGEMAMKIIENLKSRLDEGLGQSQY